MSNSPSLLDLETEFELRRLAPKVGEYTPHDARDLIITLRMFSTNSNARIGLDDLQYYRAFLQDLMEDLPDNLTPKRAGAVCRALCLTIHRQGPGFVVAWNEKQLEILEKYFQIEDEDKLGLSS